MPEFNVGETVIYFPFGSGEIVAIADKGSAGEPFLYYEIEAGERTLWIPAGKNGESGLHLPTSREDFPELISILRSQAEKMSNNRLHRYGQIEKRMENASVEEVCRVIRDLTYRLHWRSLNTFDVGSLRLAKEYLLDEWEISLGTAREEARLEMEGILQDTRRRRRFSN